MLYLHLRALFGFCLMTVLDCLIYSFSQDQQKEEKDFRKHKDFTPLHPSQLHTPQQLISFLSKGISPL